MKWAHLDERIQQVTSGSLEARIAYVLTDKYVPYAHSELIISEATWIVRQNTSRRPKCMLIFGDSGCGKSMMLDEVTRRLSVSGDPMELPVVSVSLPGSIDMRLFFIRILRALDYPFSYSDRKDVLYDQVMRALAASRTKLLVVDELHNLLLARKGMEECMVTLRDMINLPLSILGAGTNAARTCIAADDQLQHRFRCHPLRKWKVTKEVRDFIGTLESRLPLREPSNLADRDLLLPLISKSGGHPATVVTAVREAAREALLSGEERITLENLTAVITRILSERYEATA